MPWELVSGPDLGGGFLFQLTAERSGERTQLIYHAQEGGIDASGPPKGSPSPFGFAPSGTACAIGGRGCFHRSFEIESEAVPRGRLAYNRLRFVMAPMLEQQYGGAEVPLTPALEEIATRLSSEFADQPDGWYVGGAASAWLQGLPNAPRELDVGTDRSGAGRIAAALPEYLIEPLGETTWREAGRIYGARAYVGTLRSGVRLQWGVSEAKAPARGLEFTQGPSEVATRVVAVGARSVRVSRLEYALVRAAHRPDRSTESAIAGLVRSQGADGELLRRILAESGLSTVDQRRVEASVAAGTG